MSVLSHARLLRTHELQNALDVSRHVDVRTATDAGSAAPRTASRRPLLDRSGVRRWHDRGHGLGRKAGATLGRADAPAAIPHRPWWHDPRHVGGDDLRL